MQIEVPMTGLAGDAPQLGGPQVTLESLPSPHPHRGPQPPYLESVASPPAQADWMTDSKRDPHLLLLVAAVILLWGTSSLVRLPGKGTQEKANSFSPRNPSLEKPKTEWEMLILRQGRGPRAHSSASAPQPPAAYGPSQFLFSPSWGL